MGRVGACGVLRRFGVGGHDGRRKHRVTTVWQQQQGLLRLERCVFGAQADGYLFYLRLAARRICK